MPDQLAKDGEDQFVLLCELLVQFQFPSEKKDGQPGWFKLLPI